MEDMKRRLIAFYAIFTLLFVSGVFVFTLLKIGALSFDARRRAEAAAAKLGADLVSHFARHGTLADDEGARLFQRALAENDDLLVIVLSSREHGILKAAGKSRRYFVSDTYSFDDRFRPVVFRKPLGTAELERPKTTLTLTYRNVSIDARLDVLYTNFSGADASTLLSELFFILLGFFVLTLITIIISSVFTSRGVEKAAAGPGGRTYKAPADEGMTYSARSRPPAPVSGDMPSVAHTPTMPDMESEETAPLCEEPSVSTPPAAGGLEWSEEERAMRKQEIYSARTGLVRGEYFRERLALEIERAASFGEDMALFFVAVEAARSGAEPWGPETVNAFRRHFGKLELSFEYEPRTAAVIAPEMDLEAAIKTAKRLYQSLLAAGVRACLGITALARRSVAVESFCEEAAQALTQAKSGGQSPIIAFRAG